ncbi:MAG: hypothetical protein IIA67_06570 [Planctomycetes bacterium]|nr:hypothetical protein [Planctomycetota bacterium]
MIRRSLMAFALCSVLASSAALACINDRETGPRERDYQQQYEPQQSPFADEYNDQQFALISPHVGIGVVAGVGVGGLMLAAGVLFAVFRREERQTR